MGTERRPAWITSVALLVVGAAIGLTVGLVVAPDDDAETVATEVKGTSVIRSTTTGPTTTAPSTTSMAGMDHGDDVDLADRPTIVEFSGAERAALAEQLTTVREVALRYPTLADAAAAGFEPTTPFTPGLGAHMGRDDWTQPPGQALDLTKPQSYLYDGTGPTAELVGVMYVQLGGDTPPDGFVGPLDPWHAVRGQCLKADEYDPLFPAEDAVPQDRCEGAGGRYIDITAWTQHVWVVPGWEAPGGVFASDNSDIVCADGTTDSDPVEGCPSPVAR